MQQVRRTSDAKLLAQLGAAVGAVGYTSKEAQYHPHRHDVLADDCHLALCAARTGSELRSLSHSCPDCHIHAQIVCSHAQLA